VALVGASVRAVFFDAVGTLLFPEPAAPVVYADTAKQYGLELSPAEVRQRFITAYRREEELDAATNWQTSEQRERDRWWLIVTHTLAGATDPEACYRHLFHYFAQPQAWRLGPDTQRVLTTLHNRGLVLGLGSNYDERLWSVLAGFPELALLRDHVLISSEVGVRKPGAAFFDVLARSGGCEVAEVLFVGNDLANDYEGAIAAGMSALLLDPADRYSRIPHRIKQLSELL
jgi:putative hydrolase of the HAD superfamily